MIIHNKTRDIIPVPKWMLVGELRKRLSYQVAMEKMSLKKRLAECARQAAHIKQYGWKKNMRLLANIPAREYFRIQQEVDENFFKDRKNIEKLVRDNPELKGGVGT